MKNKTYPPNTNFPINIEKWFNTLQGIDSSRRYLLSNDSVELAKLYTQAIDLNALSIFIPEELGGTNLNLTQQYYYYKTLSKISGALIFLCMQHCGAMSIINSGTNLNLKEKYLKQNLHGKYTLGISFAHLRQIENPPVTAIETTTSYLVSGILPYVTGYKIFNTIVLGFVCGEKEFFALVDFVETETFKITQQLDLITANSTNTVVCNLTNHVISKDMIFIENSLGTFAANNDNRLRHLFAFTMGLASTTLELTSTHRYLKIPLVYKAYQKLFDDITALENSLFNLPENMSTIPIRVLGLDLLNKVFFFADQIFKGQATLKDHPLIQLKKEAQIITAASGSTISTLTEACNLLLR